MAAYGTTSTAMPPTLPLVQRLLSADAYPHAAAAIRLIETHISWVFLTGSYVYKVKKPVSLGFLDFSTLEQRRHFCEEEFRLNRRFAPGLYLGVVPIAGPPGVERIDGPGEPIEWAVRLRQFDDDCRLDRLLEAERLTAGDCRELARTVAAIQGRLEIAGPDTAWGTANTVRVAIDINLDQLRRHLPDRHGQIDRLSAWFDRQFASLAAVFDRRRAEGRVRQCHGDLHLANLVRLDGSMVPFDGIEFNDSLRWIDVAHDVAFLVMDLESRGRADLAAIVRSDWLEATGDHEAALLLPLFTVSRGLVRAAVAGIRGSQEGQSPEGLRSRAEAGRYLDLAERITTPAPPLLVAMCGVSGSGKTTLASSLALALGGVCIRSDVERKRLFGLEPMDRPSALADPGSLYTEEANRQTYDRLAAIARTLLASPITVVVDAACTRRWQRATLAEAARTAGVRLAWVAIDLDQATAVERVRRRQAAGTDASDASIEVVVAQFEHREPIAEDELRADAGNATVVVLNADATADPGLVERLSASLRSGG